MAEFTPKKIVLGDINNGIEFTESDGVTPNAINDPIEAVAYAQTVVEHLTDTPDTSEINGTGSPNVSFVSDTTADGVTIHKFKFSNLSGATFTPSLDEAGNLSWSNNRNLPNPPTINISGRDYLFSSEVLSGTSIPQVNSEVTDMPLTSFNRAPVDDIDHCYLFYYYTPENIYYWLATQVVDIQETTATLKILSVVRLTGYTPTIGKNGNWFIGGDDTGKPSYGASGVTDVVAGASYNQNDYTITPLTFNFEVGNSKTVNVKAAVGNVEDGSYAKLAQVVRVDAAQSLTDEEKTRAKDNLVIQTTKIYSDSTTIGWYRVAKLNRQTAYSVTIWQAYNYIEPINIKLALNLGFQEAIITQESGIISGSLLIDRVRVCVGTTTDAFFDVHISSVSFNTTKISIDRLYNSGNAVAIETYDDWEHLGTDDTVSGYTVTQLDMVSGTNTSGQVYQQGSPVALLPTSVTDTDRASGQWVVGTGGTPTTGKTMLLGTFSIYDTNIWLHISGGFARGGSSNYTTDVNVFISSLQGTVNEAYCYVRKLYTSNRTQGIYYTVDSSRNLRIYAAVPQYGKMFVSAEVSGGSIVDKGSSEDASPTGGQYIPEKNYADLSQVVRKDALVGSIEPTTDEGKNWLANKQAGFNSFVNIKTTGWYRIAKLPNLSVTKLYVFKTYSYGYGLATTITINNGTSVIDRVKATVENSGTNDAANRIERIRVYQKEASDINAVYVDVYITAAQGNSYLLKVDISASKDTIAGENFELYNFESAAEDVGSQKTTVEVLYDGGSNTNKPIYSNGSPVLVGSIDVASGSFDRLTLPSAGWYYILYRFTDLLATDYATGVFYWGKRQVLLPISYYNGAKTSRCLKIGSDGVITAYDPETGGEVSGGIATYYKLT